jgi:hypothetical protein
MRTIDADYLEELRANAAAVRDDIAERERLFEEDPQLAHRSIMEATRPPMPAIIHKRFVGKQPLTATDDDTGDVEPPPLSDEQVDVIAAALAETRIEFADTINDLRDRLDDMRDRVASLEEAMSVLTNMIGDGSNKSFVATETVRKRKLKSSPR